MSTATDSLLRLRGLTITVGERCLLRDFDLDVSPGELVALAGPSGCGKTTLLRCVCGLIDPAAGRIEVCEACGGDLGWPELRRRAVLVAQQPALYDGTIEDVLRRPFTYRCATREMPVDEARSLLDAFGLAKLPLHNPARDMSIGEKQRLCLVRALLLEPRALLLDEPTSALDADNVAAVESAIRAAAVERGLAALVVTHDRAQAERWCDRIVEMDGNVCSDGRAS